jgi:hypothetical protein
VSAHVYAEPRMIARSCADYTSTSRPRWRSTSDRPTRRHVSRVVRRRLDRRILGRHSGSAICMTLARRPSPHPRRSWVCRTAPSQSPPPPHAGTRVLQPRWIDGPTTRRAGTLDSPGLVGTSRFWARLSAPSSCMSARRTPSGTMVRLFPPRSAHPVLARR